jgi:hypothetical protein
MRQAIRGIRSGVDVDCYDVAGGSGSNGEHGEAKYLLSKYVLYIK